MSTFYCLREPISRQELENVGVKFQDGMKDDGPGMWIVEKEDTNYIHPSFHDGLIYGFTRYGGNNSNYLLDILDNNNIDFCCEYDLDDCYPVHDLISALGIDVDQDDDLYDDITDLIMDNFYSYDYYWAIRDGNGDEFLNNWVEEHREYILSQL